jgi:hypothetical protein
MAAILMPVFTVEIMKELRCYGDGIVRVSRALLMVQHLPFGVDHSASVDPIPSFCAASVAESVRPGVPPIRRAGGVRVVMTAPGDR